MVDQQLIRAPAEEFAEVIDNVLKGEPPKDRRAEAILLR